MSSDADFVQTSESDDYLPPDDDFVKPKVRPKGESSSRNGTTFRVTMKHKLLRVNGVDQGRNGDLVFNVDILNVMGSVSISNRDMKKYFTQELIAWYEKFVTFGPQVNAGSYDPK